MKKKESKHKSERGRPSPYDPLKHPQLAKKYCRQGCIDEEIAEHLGVARSTLANWKNQYPEFLDAFKEKAYVDSLVEDSLLKSASGYYVEEEELTGEYTSDGQLIGQIYKKKTHKKYIPGNPTAQALWLRNRDPSWRNNDELNVQKGLILEWIENTKKQGDSLQNANTITKTE